MPYIAREERPSIDEKVDALAEEISEALGRETNNQPSISVHYRRSFLSIAQSLSQLETGKTGQGVTNQACRDLAFEIFGGAGTTSRYSGAWQGRLNYALTRLIQVVPEKMVKKGVWKEEFRYWVYAQTVGALTRSAIQVNGLGDDWSTDGLVGVLVDVKDEYKRRVNAAYETFQIKKNGDCYTARYRTELSEVRDSNGRVAGYTEVTKDLENIV